MILQLLQQLTTILYINHYNQLLFTTITYNQLLLLLLLLLLIKIWHFSCDVLNWPNNLLITSSVVWPQLHFNITSINNATIAASNNYDNDTNNYHYYEYKHSYNRLCNQHKKYKICRKIYSF